MKWHYAMTTLAAGVLLAAGALWQIPDVEFRAPPIEEERSAAFVLASGTVAEAEQQLLPSSLQGTQHGVRLVRQGDTLLVSAALRDLFDYYLSASGELSLEQIRALIDTALQQQLNGGALAHAQHILSAYLSYKQGLHDFEQQYQADPQFSKAQQLAYLQERQQALIAFQDRELGSEVAQIFFAFDRQIDDNTLAKAAILNSDLSDAGKQQALVNLAAEQPVQQQLQQQRIRQQQRLVAIDQQNLSAADKFQQREAVVGADAAHRLAELDESRQRWDERLSRFQQEVSVLQQAGLDRAEYQESYQQLLNQQFQPHEQLRVKVLTTQR